MYEKAPQGILARLSGDSRCGREGKQAAGALVHSWREGEPAPHTGSQRGWGQGLSTLAQGGPTYPASALSTAEAAGFCGLLYLTVYNHPDCACMQLCF